MCVCMCLKTASVTVIKQCVCNLTESHSSKKFVNHIVRLLLNCPGVVKWLRQFGLVPKRLEKCARGDP